MNGLPDWFPSPLEWAGFATGAACVWLVVRQHVWNFPLGIASSHCFLFLFVQQRLYGEAGLQVFFIALGFHGWYNWLRGGPRHTELQVSRAPRAELAVLGVVLVFATGLLAAFLWWVGGSAPLIDGHITALSLVAQWMLNRKSVENWPVWMLVDVLTVGLSAYRGLYLVAALYVIFFAMCVAGLVQWRRALVKVGDSLRESPQRGGEEGQLGTPPRGGHSRSE